MPDALNRLIGSVKFTRYGVISLRAKMKWDLKSTSGGLLESDRGSRSTVLAELVQPNYAVACIADVVFGCPARAARPSAAKDALLQLWERGRGCAEFTGISGKAARIAEGEIPLRAQGRDLFFQLGKEVVLTSRSRISNRPEIPLPEHPVSSPSPPALRSSHP